MRCCVLIWLDFALFAWKTIHDYKDAVCFFSSSLSHENCCEQRNFFPNFSKATHWNYLEGWTINDNFIRKNSNNVETNTINAMIYGYIKAFKRIFHFFFSYIFFLSQCKINKHFSEQKQSVRYDRAYGASTCVPFWIIWTTVLFF